MSVDAILSDIVALEAHFGEQEGFTDVALLRDAHVASLSAKISNCKGMSIAESTRLIKAIKEGGGVTITSALSSMS